MTSQFQIRSALRARRYLRCWIRDRRLEHPEAAGARSGCIASQHSTPECALSHTFRRWPKSALSSVFSIHYSPLPPRPLPRLPRSHPHSFLSRELRSFPKSDEGSLSGSFDRCFFRYFPENDLSSLSGSLPRSMFRSFPRSTLSPSPRSYPRSFPDSSASNFAINLPTSLPSSKVCSDAGHFATPRSWSPKHS
jgi:hypothetical protein